MVNFRFSTESPPQQLFTDFQNLNAFNNEQFSQLTEILLNFLAQQGGELMDSVSGFAQQHGVNEAVLKNTVGGILFFFKGAIRNNLTPQMVREDLVHLGLGDEKATSIATQWKAKFIALSRSVIGQTLMVNQLVDLDWKFGVTASSSEIAKVGQTFLQLKLVLDKGNNIREDVLMELTLPQFYEFLHEMQKAKANIDYFSY